MIRLALIAVLVTQTYEGKMSVVDGLSDHACEEARCVALHGMSCEAKKAADKQADEVLQKMDDEYVKAHPKEVAACEAGERAENLKHPNFSRFAFCRTAPWIRNGTSGDIDSAAVKTAQCVK